MYRLGKKVSDHVISWEILNIELSMFDAVCNEKVPDVNVFGTLRTGTLYVVLQEYGRLVVFVHDRTVYSIVLFIQKVVVPAELGHDIICSNNFSFSRAPSVELLTNKFVDAQYYGINVTIMYQYNLSAILLKNNGKHSSSKRTKHINIRYFFITDRIKHGELNIEYCPTDDMVANFFTKP